MNDAEEYVTQLQYVMLRRGYSFFSQGGQIQFLFDMYIFVAVVKKLVNHKAYTKSAISETVFNWFIFGTYNVNV